jgi:hypothetical protein
VSDERGLNPMWTQVPPDFDWLPPIRRKERVRRFFESAAPALQRAAEQLRHLRAAAALLRDNESIRKSWERSFAQLSAELVGDDGGLYVRDEVEYFQRRQRAGARRKRERDMRRRVLLALHEPPPMGCVEVVDGYRFVRRPQWPIRWNAYPFTMDRAAWLRPPPARVSGSVLDLRYAEHEVGETSTSFTVPVSGWWSFQSGPGHRDQGR